MSTEGLQPDQTLLKEIRALRRSIDDLVAIQRAALLPAERVFTFHFHDKEIRLALPRAEADTIQRIILRTGSFYELPVLSQLRSFVQPGAVVVDAGANIGNHSVFFARILAARRVIAYEPQRYAFDILRRNAELNAPDIIDCRNVALGAKATRARIVNYGPTNLGATSFAFDEAGDFDVMRLDDENLDELHLLKIDVEGAQSDVIAGAERTLEQHRPIVLCEVQEMIGDNRATYEFFEARGYDKCSLNYRNVIFLPH